MTKYRVLHPIGYAGRRERGDIVDLPDSIANSFLTPGLVELYDGPKEEAPAPQVNSDNLDSLTVNQLRDKAKELGLSATGSKADLVEKISLALAGESDDSDKDEE